MKEEGNVYALDVIRQAFWNTFHESGEVWFNDQGNQDENGQSTESVWNEFLTELQNIKTLSPERK